MKWENKKEKEIIKHKGWKKKFALLPVLFQDGDRIWLQYYWTRFYGYSYVSDLENDCPCGCGERTLKN